MRFHFGVSFSWKQIKKIILPILIGIGLYFGFSTTIVNAETFTLPITGGGGGLTYQGGVSGGQTKWCTKTINSTEYVYRCGGLYNDTFSAGVNLPGGVDNLLSYSTQWYTNSSSLCGTSQTSVEFYVYAYPYNSFGGPGYDFWSYYNIASIAYPPSSNGTCSYSRISKNMLKVNCTYDSDEFFQFNIYGSLNGKTPPSQTAFQMLIKRNVTYVCNATNNDLNNTLNNGFNNMTNVFDEKLEQLKETLGSTNDEIGEINDYLTSDEQPSSDISSLGNVQGLLPPGPVDSLLNIPFDFLSIVISSMGNVCVPLTGDFIFGSTLTIPCFGDTFYDNVPAGLMVFLNVIPSIFILIPYFKHLYKKIDRAVSMNSNSDDTWGVL